MFCENCGASLAGNEQFCPKCGNRMINPTSMEANPPIVEQPKKHKKEKKKKSKAKKVFITILCVLVLVGIAGGVLAYMWYTSPEQNILRALESGDYDEAISLYTDDYEGSSKSIESVLQDRLEKIKDDYINGEMEYAVAIMELDAIKKMGVNEIEQELNDTRTYINSLNQSRTAFETAEKMFAEGDYEGAIEQYQLVSEDDSNYDTAKDKLVDAIDKYREQVLSEAETLAGEGSYQEAMKKIKTALEVIPNDTKLQPEYEKYSADYVNSILTEVDGLVADGDYNSAISQINEALKVVGTNEELEAKLEDVQGSKPVALSSLTPINGGWTWNEGTPTDSFGTTYSNASNFVVLNNLSGEAKYAGENVDIDGYYGIYETYAEYRLYGDYAQLTFDVVPHSSIEEELYGTVKVYTDDVLVFSSPQITRKTDLQNYQVDVSNAEYIKIVVDTVGDKDSVLLMNCMLSK